MAVKVMFYQYVSMDVIEALPLLRNLVCESFDLKASPHRRIEGEALR